MAARNIAIASSADDSLSDREYSAALGLLTTLGLGLTAALAVESVNLRLGFGAALLLGLVLPFAGIMIVNATRRWELAFLGFMMVAAPFGVLMGTVLAHYRLTAVETSLEVTAIISGGMWIIGTIMPPIVRNLSGYIVGALLLLIVGMFASWFVPGMMGPISWLGAILFTGLLVYDVNKAHQMPRNMYNAVANSLSMYLDIYNLFNFILRIVGNRN